MARARGNHVSHPSKQSASKARMANPINDKRDNKGFGEGAFEGN